MITYCSTLTQRRDAAHPGLVLRARSQRARPRCRALGGLGAWLLVAAVAGVGCGGESVAIVDASESSDSTGTQQGGISAEELDGGEDSEAAASRMQVCAGKRMGAPCLDGRHCIAGACVWNSCGDGVKAGTEECDDGNAAGGDGCDPACRAEATGCGNAIVETGEECDDGNRIDVDACSNACMINQCGNGRVELAEECDDGNRIDDDSCSNACKVARCRNGRVDPGEECDDGNQNDTDGCTNKCRIMICGNGEREEKEECDDANQVDTDGCSNHCTQNVCGNDRIDPGEECDGEANCDEQCHEQTDLCTPCELEKCAAYLEQPLVAGCYDNTPDPTVVVVPPKPGEFSDPCKALLACTRKARCVGNASQDYGSKCYCGDGDPTACIQDGPVVCQDEFYKAAQTTDPVQTALRLADTTYPIGYAYWMMTCDVENCRKECAPWLDASPGSQ